MMDMFVSIYVHSRVEYIQKIEQGTRLINWDSSYKRIVLKQPNFIARLIRHSWKVNR